MDEPIDPTGRGEGPHKTRKMLAALLGAGVLTDDAERALLSTAGEAGVHFSDAEAVGVVEANPNVAGISVGELDEQLTLSARRYVEGED